MSVYDVKILVDCDGVLLNWSYGFNEFMSNMSMPLLNENVYAIKDRYNISEMFAKNLISAFNSSSSMRSLPPYKDSIKYIRKLKEEHGIVFTVISSFSDSTSSHEDRKHNLETHFGKGTFEEFIFLGEGESKERALSRYRDSGITFIEDLPDNIVISEKLGLSPVILRHAHNDRWIQNCRRDGLIGSIEVADSWKDFYESNFD